MNIEAIEKAARSAAQLHADLTAAYITSVGPLELLVRPELDRVAELVRKIELLAMFAKNYSITSR